jgi:hypothetical protein
MNISTLVMVAVIASIAMLSAGLSLISVQQASANLVQDGDGGDTSFSFEQKQSNKCSGFAGCTNTGTITFGF